MTQPTPPKLRRAIVSAYSKGYGTYEEVADLLGLSRGTVSRVLHLHKRGYSLDPKVQSGGRKSPISKESERLLLAFVRENSDATIDELRQLWKNKTGQAICRSSWHREMHRLRYSKTRKTMKPRAALRTDVAQKRVDFMELMPTLPVSKLKFLDESGFKADLQRKDAWAPVGQSGVFLGSIHQSKNVTVMGVISMLGLTAINNQSRPMNTRDFERFIEDEVSPAMEKGDFLIMDNLRSHRSSRVRQWLTSFGVQPLFLPPYSPDLNPIEMFWAVLKRLVRSLNNEHAGERLALKDFCCLLDDCCRELGDMDFLPFISHCGYRIS